MDHSGSPHHGHGHGHGQSHDHEASLPDLLDLDADVHRAFLDDATAWADEHSVRRPQTIVDVGAGTGTGTLALARRFPDAALIALDRSPAMIARLRESARTHGFDGRLRVVDTDLDAPWPELGSVDLIWAALSLHHVQDPDRILRDMHSSLNPGGLLVVVEMDGFPRFLPEDIGIGQPGLEERCHRIAALQQWNSYPNWRGNLEQAGFDVVSERRFDIDIDPVPRNGRQYAHATLTRMRQGFAEQLSADDLAALDVLLADDDPRSVLHRDDVTVRGSRTAWVGRV